MIGRRGGRAGAGDLDQRILIQRLTYTPDGAGGQVGTVVDVARPWAKVVTLGVREQLRADQLAPQGTVRFTIRHRPDLTTDDWIIYRGDRYNIRGFVDGGTRDLLMDIDAERGVAD